MKIECKDCGYSKDILEKEYLDGDKCVLCGGDMLLSIVDKKEEPKIETEDIGEVIRKSLLTTMIADIKDLGEEAVWDMINETGMEDRLCLLEAFIEAKKELKIE